MKLNLYIRCDASPQIGLGHLVRCVALAEMLKNKFEITFFCREIPNSHKHDFKFSLAEIKTEDEFLQQISRQSLVILDGYHLHSSYQKIIKSTGAILACIVDLPDQDFFADLIINHSPGANQLDYRAQLYTHFAFGLDYALLRPPFLEEARRKRIISKIDSVIICFGGSDPLNLTERVLHVVKAYRDFKKIILVVGPMYAELDKLNTHHDEDPRIDVYRNVSSDQLLKLLLQAPLAIVPASGILMEAIAAGNRIISGIYIENQKLVYESFKEEGSLVDAGTFLTDEIKNAVEVALKIEGKINKCIDGLSNERLVKKFDQLSISNNLILRKANENDLATTYSWATNPAIRAFSFQQKEIKWEEHAAWYQNKIHDEKCFYFIGELLQDCIGSVRFDLQGGEAVISYLIDNRFHSRGYGLILLAQSFKSLVQELVNKDISVHSLTGYVMFNNYPSIKTFVNLGFRKTEQDGKLKFIKHV